MKDSLGFAVLGLVLVLVVVVGNVLLIVSHEAAHVQINRYFGVESEPRYELFQAYATMPSAPPEGKRDYLYTLHAMNEIFGYQTSAMFNGMALFVIVALLFSRMVMK